MIRLEEKVWDRMMVNIVGVGDWIGRDGGQSGSRIPADANCSFESREGSWQQVLDVCVVVDGRMVGG